MTLTATVAVAATGAAVTTVGTALDGADDGDVLGEVLTAVGSPVELSVDPQATRATQSAAVAIALVATTLVLRFHRLPNIGWPPSSGRLPACGIIHYTGVVNLDVRRAGKFPPIAHRHAILRGRYRLRMTGSTTVGSAGAERPAVDARKITPGRPGWAKISS
ncbi:MAG: hypothetical protein ABJD68_00480 [Nakamurella sp.]